MRKELETPESSFVVIEAVSDDILALDNLSLELVGGGAGDIGGAIESGKEAM